jgi:hypothetical protein
MTSNSVDPTISNSAIRNLFADKLSHYSRRDPKTFLQLDGFHVTNGGDDVMRPDEDGDCLHASPTTELMYGAAVRVLIPGDTDRKVAIRQLKKLAKWLKRNPDLMDYAKTRTFESSDKLGADIPF